MKNKIEIISNSSRRARVTMLVPFRNQLTPVETGPSNASLDYAAPIANPCDQQSGEFETLQDLAPSESDYIHPVFRALSASVIPGYWLDYSTPGVLEESAPLLQGQTVYKNHNFQDVEQWLGVVSRAFWDASGVESGGVPGINVEMKIDWKMNPRIARGLLMQPPAIHSASVTVLFEYEYSHTGLAESARFWEMLGEEVDGEIVRLVVTKILGYWEISLVFQGADQLARQISEAPEVTNEMSIGANAVQIDRAACLTPRIAELLGLSEREIDALTEETLAKRISELKNAADQGQQMLGFARNETLRVARLAEADHASGVAGPVEQLINTAAPDQLEQLTHFYTERAASRFPHTCQNCGATSHNIRSSIEPPLKELAERSGMGIADALH